MKRKKNHFLYRLEDLKEFQKPSMNLVFVFELIDEVSDVFSPVAIPASKAGKARKVRRFFPVRHFELDPGPEQGVD